jgi:hypothetical protein
LNSAKQKLRGARFAVWLLSQNFAINFTLTARVRGTITPEQFERALGKLRLKYPPLSTRMDRESNGDIYIIPDAGLEFPVRTVERQHSGSWIEEVTRELAQTFDMFNQPPIRFTWLRGDDVSDIVFACPHVLVDGLSVAYLVRDFLVFLSDPEANVEPVPPAPPISEMIPDFPGKQLTIWKARLQAAMFKVFLRLASGRDEQTQDQTGDPRSTYHQLAWALTPEQTAALVARSRAEGTTVHAALSVAFLRARGESRAMGELRGNSWKRKIQSPINLRDRLTGPVGESFGLYVNLAEFPVNCAPERDFWDVAREIKRKFIRYTGDRYIFDSLVEANVVMGELAPVITPQLVARSMKITYDLSITNLGRLDFPVQYGPLLLEALFGPSLGGDPEDIVLGVITVGGRMHFALTFTGLKLNTSQAEQIKETAMTWLARATSWTPRYDNESERFTESTT